jgi:hypothetical protein
VKEIAEIRYTKDAKRIMRIYYARYQINYEKFSQEVYESIAENMREYRDIFFDDRIVSENLMKNEKNTFFYKELSAVEKTEEGYLIYITKNSMLFYGFDEFKPESLGILDEILKPYLVKREEALAIIKNFEYTEDKIRKIKFKKFFNLRLLLVLTAYLFLICGILIDSESKFLYILLALGITIEYLYFYFIQPKRILKSMNKKPMKAKVLFFENRIEVISKLNAEVLVLKYEEFFRIKKIKSGILFYIHKYTCFLFEYSEIEGDIEKLKKILFQNTNSRK